MKKPINPIIHIPTTPQPKGRGLSHSQLLSLIRMAGKLVDAVERYVEPKPGDEYMHRSDLLAVKNDLKALLTQ